MVSKRIQSFLAAAMIAAPLSFAAAPALADGDFDFAGQANQGNQGAYSEILQDSSALTAPNLQSPSFAPSYNASAAPLPQQFASAQTNARLHAQVSAGPLSMGAPWMFLGGFAALGSLIWLLSRMNPPQPQTHKFPSLRLVFELQSRVSEPKSLPLWRKLLRLTAAAAVVAGLSQPFMDQGQLPSGDGPVMIVVDNGWAAAQNWESRRDMLQNIIADAQDQGRQIVLLPTAMSSAESFEIVGPISAQEAAGFVDRLQANPWPVDHEAMVARLSDLNITSPASVLWLSNGLSSDGTFALESALTRDGDIDLFVDTPDRLPHVIRAASISSDGYLDVRIERADDDRAALLGINLMAENNTIMAHAEISFESGAREAFVRIPVASDIRDSLAQVRIEGQEHAGATFLMDERWRHRPVGIASTPGQNSGNSLLQETHFISQALGSQYELFEEQIGTLISKNLAVLITTDDTVLNQGQQARLEQWVQDGGTMLRFAGPGMAQNPDALLPVTLVQDRNMPDGVMRWEEPQSIVINSGDHPLANLDIPQSIQVQQQVMARPDVGGGLAARTWVSLEDGTPLITAENRGEGQIILVHTKAMDADWSNLALSHVFVDLLEDIVQSSQGIVGAVRSDGTLPLRQIVTSAGDLEQSDRLVSLSRRDAENGIVGAESPPGFYGNDRVRRAHNLVSSLDSELSLRSETETAPHSIYSDQARDDNLKAVLLPAALLLLLADMGVSIASSRRRKKAAPQPQQNGPQPV